MLPEYKSLPVQVSLVPPPSIRIRGMGSFNASNSPLYVIDGVPVQSGSVAATSSDSGFDIMSTLNNSDIEK